MDFVIDFQGKVGLRERGKWWKVIDNHTCFIADARIDKLFSVTRDWVHHSQLSCYDRKAHTGLLRYAVIRTTTTGDSMIIVVTSTPASTKEEEACSTQLRLLADTSHVTTVVWGINTTSTDISFAQAYQPITGLGAIEEQINGFRYRISPGAFFQTNSRAAAVLQQLVLDSMGDVSTATVLDLFCGSGFFTIPIAHVARNVVGIELVSSAIEDARVNAQLNNVTIEWHASPVERVDIQQYRPDVVIVDPPRVGLPDPTLRSLLNAPPPRLVYVSCHYKSFAREMTFLDPLYKVTSLTALDQFPHTPHVELVAVLERRAL